MDAPFSTLRQLGTLPLVPQLSTARILENPDLVELRRVAGGLAPDGGELGGDELAGKTLAMVATDGVEEIELVLTRKYFQDRGARVHLVAPEARYKEADGNLTPLQRKTHILTIQFIDHGGWVPIDVHLRNASTDDYDAVIIPGGAWNPDTLRADEAVLDFVRAMDAADKVVAAICHGPWVLVNAGLLEGKAATCWPGIRVDLQNAGADYRDEAVVVSGRTVTSRQPLDIPDFCKAIAGLLEE